MGFSLSVICVAIFFIILGANPSASNEHGNNINGDPSENGVNSRGSSLSQENYSSAWMDRKLGKQKINNLLRDKNKMAHILEILDEYLCPVFTGNDGTGMQKRDGHLYYTPRLGRNVEDVDNARDIPLIDRSSFSTSQRSRRPHGSSYSPRLGRDESDIFL